MYVLNQQLLAAIRDLDAALLELRDQSQKFADAERNYRRAKSEALLQVEGRNVQEREARAEKVMFAVGALGDIRYARDLADGLKGAASQAVKAKTQVVSAIQTMASGMREEMRFGQYGPEIDQPMVQAGPVRA